MLFYTKDDWGSSTYAFKKQRKALDKAASNSQQAVAQIANARQALEIAKQEAAAASKKAVQALEENQKASAKVQQSIEALRAAETSAVEAESEARKQLKNTMQDEVLEPCAQRLGLSPKHSVAPVQYDDIAQYLLDARSHRVIRTPGIAGFAALTVSILALIVAILTNANMIGFDSNRAVVAVVVVLLLVLIDWCRISCSENDENRLAEALRAYLLQ